VSGMRADSGPGPHGYGSDLGGYGPPRKPRRATRLLFFAAVALVAAVSSTARSASQEFHGYGLQSAMTILVPDRP
jgi:hypothetical protein